MTPVAQASFGFLLTVAGMVGMHKDVEFSFFVGLVGLIAMVQTFF